MQYDEFSPDIAENRIIKATLNVLARRSQDESNKRKLRKLLFLLDSVGDAYNYEDEFSKIHINRMNKHYDMLISWAHFFLRNESFTSFSGKHNAPALLFQMEKLFEDYVAAKVLEIFGQEEWQVET